jgi:hypothetical protein
MGNPFNLFIFITQSTTPGFDVISLDISYSTGGSEPDYATYSMLCPDTMYSSDDPLHFSTSATDKNFWNSTRTPDNLTGTIYFNIDGMEVCIDGLEPIFCSFAY